MRKRQANPFTRNIHNILLHPVLLMSSLWIIGCTAEFLQEDKPVTERDNAVLSLSTRIGDITAGSGNENIVKTLRLMVFNSAGAQIANTYYEETLLEELKNGDGKTFTLTQRLPRDLGQINVCLIANEPQSWDLGRTTDKVSYIVLQNLTIHYLQNFDFINNNGNVDDLNLYVSPDDYFLMYVETATNFIAGNMSITDVLQLKRTAAKVTLVLGYDRLSDVNYDNGEDFELKSVSIQNQPLYSFLFGATYDSDEFFSSAYQVLVYKQDTKVTEPVSFYIPEHYLSENAFNSNLKTYIEVLGEYTTGGIKVPVIYKIPLGEGVQKIYTMPNYTPSIEDYTIVRNHHYTVNGKITRLGEKDGLQAQISILPWVDGGNIEVDTPAPYLNVSDIALKRTISSAEPDISDKIFFWTNQPQDQLTFTPATVTYYEADGLPLDLSGLSPELLPLVGMDMVKYSVSGNPGNFFENNGHVTVNVHLPQTILWRKLVLTFHVKAGNLKRLIRITYHTETITR